MLCRCNGEFDCPDGSDETEDFCDLSQNRDVFICCSGTTKVPLEHLCDGFDDCPRDKSDQFLAACFEPIQNNVSETQEMFCPARGPAYSEGYFINIKKEQLNDGISDCLFDIDETCAWKNNLKDWISPTKNKEFEEYLEFLRLAKESPSATRWYTMATQEEIAQLGHSYEVGDRFVFSAYWRMAASSIRSVLLLGR